MFSSRYASTGADASSINCVQEIPIIVRNQQDASTVGACKIFDGAVDIAVTDPNANGMLDFGSINTITGPLSMTGPTTITSVKFSSLKSVGGLYFHELSNLTELYLGQLQEVGAMEISSLSSLANLDIHSVQNCGTFTISNNLQLSELNAQSLALIEGDVILENNTSLGTIELPALTNISQGSAFLTGNFSDLSLPLLVDIQGSLTVTSSNSDFDCKEIKSLDDRHVAKLPVNCNKDVSEPSSTTAMNTSTSTMTNSGTATMTSTLVPEQPSHTSSTVVSSSVSSSGLSNINKIAIVIGVSVGGALLLFVVMYLVWRRRKRYTHFSSEKPWRPNHVGTADSIEPGTAHPIEPGIAIYGEPGVAVD